MTKRALIVGSQIAGLSGVDNDIEEISKRLSDRKFEIQIHRGDAASQEGIRAGLRKIIHDSRYNDQALIYYSGHGARVSSPGPIANEAENSPLLQCLVPTDWSHQHFRGLLSLELSLCLAELTQQTRNVTLILDACHSARMWKDASCKAVPRALKRLRVGGVGDALTELRSRDRSGLFPESNPHAVRLVAAEADRSAYEMATTLDGRELTMGVLTAALCEVLDEIGKALVTWRTLALLVRERVMYHYELQRPDLEGPGQRWALETGSAELEGGVVYFEDEGLPSLRTSRLLGAEIGARYAIMDPGQHKLRLEAVVAEAQIISFTGTCARVELKLRENGKHPQIGALAFLLESPLGKRGVRLHGPPAVIQPLNELIAESRFVTKVEAGPFIEVVNENEGLRLRAVSGEALNFPTSSNSLILRALERWAQADMVRSLASGNLTASYEFTWGRVINGKRIRMDQGDMSHVGDGIYVEFKNHSNQTLYFTVFDIGIDGTVTLLTSAEPTGTKVESGSTYSLGLEVLEHGMILHWPKSVPTDQALPESLLVIVSSERHDFTALETGKKRPCGPESTLGQLLAQIGSGGMRSAHGQNSADVGAYSIARIDFMTSPQQRTVSVQSDS